MLFLFLPFLHCLLTPVSCASAACVVRKGSAVPRSYSVRINVVRNSPHTVELKKHVCSSSLGGFLIETLAAVKKFL